MSSVTAPASVALRPKVDRRILPAVVIAAIVVFGLATGKEVPTWLDIHLRPWVDDVYHWTVIHRDKNILFTGVFSPISKLLSSSTDGLLWFLRWLRWPGVLTLVSLIGLRVGGIRSALAGGLAMAACGVLGYWDQTMVSLSLMLVSVIVSLLIGVPLGIWAGLNDRVDRRLRGVLDAAQVMPAYVYLLPIVVLFGIGNPAAVVATVIFAVSPAVRLTSLGIRGVPVVANEVGVSFGSNRRQLLTKVQLPLARRPMLLGLNQVIMMAFGIVVIAALIGTGGLGSDVLAGLQKVNVGRAFSPGLAIVFAAISLDRITTGQRRPGAGAISPLMLLGGGMAVLAVTILAHLTNTVDFPSFLTLDLAKPVNDAVKTINEHIRTGVPVVGGTAPFSDFMVLKLLSPLRDFLWACPWWSIVAAAVAVGWASGGRRLGLLCGACGVGIASLRVWDLALDTLSQVLVAVGISVALAVPIGILAGRSDRFDRVLRPILDAMQVLPPFVYLVPVISLFNVGRVPGVIASVVYALPPAIRLTSLGLRGVPFAPREAATSFGATPRQELLKVQIPLALRSIMLGINQTILMVLSMVIVAALVGAGALGLETVYGLTKSEIGRGVSGGVAIVLLAIVLDRTTQAWGTRADFTSPSTQKREP